jgi:hypothetical protein
MSGYAPIPILALDREATLRPSERALTVAASALHVALPRSYREFVSRYGFGVACGAIVVSVPLEPEAPAAENLQAANLLTFVPAARRELDLAVRGEWMEYAPDGNPELVARLLPFGRAVGGDGNCDLLAWDTSARSADEEYWIYMVGAENSFVCRAAPNLAELLAMATAPLGPVRRGEMARARLHSLLGGRGEATFEPLP